MFIHVTCVVLSVDDYREWWIQVVVVGGGVGWWWEAGNSGGPYHCSCLVLVAVCSLQTTHCLWFLVVTKVYNIK